MHIHDAYRNVYLHVPWAHSFSFCQPVFTSVLWSFFFSSFEIYLILYVSLPVHKIHVSRFWLNVFIRILPAQWSRGLFENLSVALLINKFPSFYRLRMFITVFSTADHWILILAHFNIILKSTRTDPKGSLSFKLLVHWKTQQ